MTRTLRAIDMSCKIRDSLMYPRKMCGNHFRAPVYLCVRHHHCQIDLRCFFEISNEPRSEIERWKFFLPFRMHPLLNGNILVAISLYDFLFSPLCFKFNLFPLPIELDSMDRIIFELFLQAVERAIDTSVFSLFIVNGCAGSYPHTHTHPLKKTFDGWSPAFSRQFRGWQEILFAGWIDAMTVLRVGLKRDINRGWG